MPSKIQVDQIAGATGSTVTLPSGQTLDLSSGTVNLPSASLSALNATNLTSGTVPSARLSLTSSDLPTVPTTKGGTGLTTIGTAAQVLRVNSGATGLEYGTVSGGLIKVGTFEDTTRRSLSVAGDTIVFSFTYNKVQNATTSKLIIIGSIPGFAQYSNTCGIYFDCLTAGITSHNTNDSFAFKGVFFGNANGAGQPDFITITKTYEDANLGSGNHVFEWGWKPRNGSTSDRPYEIINYNSSDDARQHATSSVFQVFEVTI